MGAKRPTTWHDDDYLYFELNTPELEVFDGQNDGAVYPVQDFVPGPYRLPIDAIRLATDRERGDRAAPHVSVDACQLFLADRTCAARLRATLDPREGGWPNYPYLDRLRREVGTDFGLAELTADGSYVLDIGQLARVPPAAGVEPRVRPAGEQDLYAKVARRMRTFVCERCFEEELAGSEGSDPQVLARLARERGWRLLPHPAGESGFFEGFRVVGPRCAAAG